MKVKKRWYCPRREVWIESTWRERRKGGPQKGYKEKVIYR